MTVIFKTIGLILIFLTGALGGFYIAFKNENELKNLNLFISYILELRNRILYNGGEIEELIRKIFVKKELITLNDGKILISDRVVRKKDLKILEEFFTKLGSTEQSSEIARADLCLSRLKESQKELSAEISEKSRLYRILGVSFGILGCILVI